MCWESGTSHVWESHSSIIYLPRLTVTNSIHQRAWMSSPLAQDETNALRLSNRWEVRKRSLITSIRSLGSEHDQFRSHRTSWLISNKQLDKEVSHMPSFHIAVNSRSMRARNTTKASSYSLRQGYWPLIPYLSSLALERLGDAFHDILTYRSCYFTMTYFRDEEEKKE